MKKRFFAVFLTAVLVLTSVGAAFAADTGNGSWNSRTIYPTDVPVNTELFTSVKLLVDKKIIKGYEDGTFKPEQKVTRAEMAVILTKMTNRSSGVEAAKTQNKFTDMAGSQYDWARGQVNVLSDAGILKGTSDTTFDPKKEVSYAELITMLIRTNQGAASELEGTGTWPDNYISFAERNTMLGNVKVTDWKASATRGDMARLVYRFTPKN